MELDFFLCDAGSCFKTFVKELTKSALIIVMVLILKVFVLECEQWKILK